MPLHVKLLGPPRFFSDGRELTFPFRKVLALACYLLVERRASREVLADLFWGDRPDELAARNLRNALYELRKQFPSGLIQTDRRWVSVEPEGLELDLDVLSGAEAPLADRAGLYGRPFMEGFSLPECPSFEDWLRETRVRCDRTFRRVMKQMAQKALDAGDPGEALVVLEQLRDRKDLDEEAFRLSMIAYARQGRRGRVAELYRLLEERLRRELNVAASGETEQLYRELVDDPDSPEGMRAGPEVQREGTPFFGRMFELTRMADFARGASFAPRCIVVSGEAGVGKTALVREFLSRLPGEENLTLSCWASQGEGRYALLPWNDLVGELSGTEELDSLDFPSSLLSLLRESFPSLGIAPTSSAPASTTRIGGVLADLFRRLAAKKRVFLVFEDLQWLDVASLEVLESLLLHRPEGVVFLFTARPDPRGHGESLLRSLSRAGRLDLLRLELKTFDRKDMEGFCRKYLPGKTFSEEELERLFLQTEGLPLFLAELLRLIASGRSPEESPTSLAEAIEGILAQVTEEERVLLECLSVFLGRAEWDLLRLFSGIPEDRLAAMTDRLKGLSILSERVEDGRRLFIEFSHFKVREHIRGGLSAARNRFLHRRLSKLLMEDMERRGWNDLACSRIVWHCRAADMVLEELEYTIRKLRLHIKLHYELFPLFDDRFLRNSSSAFEGRNHTMRELREVRALLGHAREDHGDSARLGELEMAYRTILGGYMLWWGEYDQGEKYIRAVLDRAAIVGNTDLEAECLQHLCYLGIQIEDGDFLESHAQRLMEVAVKRDDDPVQGMCFRFLGLARIFRQNFLSAERSLQASIGRFEELGLVGKPYTLQKAAALNYLGSTSHRAGRFGEALQVYEACIRHCADEGIYRGACLFHSNAAHTAYDMGDRETMIGHLEAAKSDLEECQWWRGNSVLFSLLALLSGERGEAEKAVYFLQRADELCIPLNKRYWLALQFWVKGLLKRDARTGDALDSFLEESSRAYLIRSGDLYREMGVDYMVERVEKLLS